MQSNKGNKRQVKALTSEIKHYTFDIHSIIYQINEHFVICKVLWTLWCFPHIHKPKKKKSTVIPILGRTDSITCI